jgi:dihydroorotase-like cyclic amidohydrolase
MATASSCPVSPPLHSLAGLVDIGCHFQEPSHEDWENYYKGTKAACAGGVTTVFDMPMLGEPHATTAAGLEGRLKCAQERLWVDCGFLAGVKGDVLASVNELAKAGAFAFVVHYGTQQYYNFEPISLDTCGRLLDQLAAASLSLPLLISCEACSEAELLARSPYLKDLSGVGFERRRLRNDSSV